MNLISVLRLRTRSHTKLKHFKQLLLVTISRILYYPIKIYSDKYIWELLIFSITRRRFRKYPRKTKLYFFYSYKYADFFKINNRVQRRFGYSTKLTSIFKKIKRNTKKLLNKRINLTQYLKNEILVRFWQKSIQHTNFLKFFFLRTFFIPNKKIAVFTLRRKIFINSSTLARELTYLVHTLTKPAVTKKFLKTRLLHPTKFPITQFGLLKHQTNTIFYNAHKSLIWKMRTARYAHWSTQMRGTLNEWRYDKLLARSLNFYNSFFQKQLLCVIFANIYCCFLSWKSYTWFFTLNISFLNGYIFDFRTLLQQGDILEFPYGPGLRYFTSYTKTKYLRRVYRVKRFLYKLIKKRQISKYKRSKFCQKPLQNLPISLQSIGRLIAIDPSSKTVGILKKLPYLTHSIANNATVSAVLTLQNWRFRFDKWYKEGDI